MRKLWRLLAAGSILGALAIGMRASGQNDRFGVMGSSRPTTPPAPTSKSSSTILPPGIEPVGSSGYTAAPNPYPITAEASTWLICAAHYSGPECLALATQTVEELKAKFRLPVYLMNRADDERRKQDQEWEEYKKKMHGAPVRRRIVRIEDEYAVLIGGMKDFNAATAFLPKVRNMPLPKLKTESGRSPFAEMFFTVPNGKKRPDVKAAKVNPYSQAMVVRNPLAGGTAGKTRYDPFLEKLNANEVYSLLKNPRRYTLMIKEYQGAVQVESGKSTGSVFSMFGGNKQSDSLSACAAQANELARVLRQPNIGLDAFVLHTRHASIVTIGSFDSTTDPAILNIARRLDTLRGNKATDTHGLMTNLLVVEVPRKEN